MVKLKSKSSLLGAVGGIIIGAAILLFVATIVLTSLRGVNVFSNADINETYENNSDERAAWNDSNDTYNQLNVFLSVSSILLGVLGIVMIGAAIIQYIGGAFGG